MSLDERQETVLRTFTREQLEGMPLEDIVKLVLNPVIIMRRRKSYRLMLIGS